jgi:deoxycytidylate deaminase
MTAAKKDSGIVDIHGKQYQTVAYRVQQFRDKYPIETGWSITANIVDIDDVVVVMQATITDPEKRVVATGYAEEKRNASQINRTSAVENAETSAIGRALAAAGWGGTEYATADEVANAITQQRAPQTAPVRNGVEPTTEAPITEQQKKMLAVLAHRVYGPDADDKRHELVEAITKGRSKSSNDLTKAEASRLIDGLQSKATELGV